MTMRADTFPYMKWAMAKPRESTLIEGLASTSRPNCSTKLASQAVPSGRAHTSRTMDWNAGRMACCGSRLRWRSPALEERQPKLDATVLISICKGIVGPVGAEWSM